RLWRRDARGSRSVALRQRGLRDLHRRDRDAGRLELAGDARGRTAARRGTKEMIAGFKPKNQRLVLLLIALIALIGAALLAIWALRNQASYFYVPSDMAADPP